MSLLEITGMLGMNRAAHDRFLDPQVGVISLNQKPSRAGHMEPWRQPLTHASVVIPASPQRNTIYRMGRDAQTPTTHWLSWTAIVHAIRGFDPSDPTERTYYTDGTGPKVTDNIMALATTPYPTAWRELAVPQPDVAPIVTMFNDGPSGDARQPVYVYTWVNDWGWESAPSPPTESPLAKPGAVLDLEAPAVPPAGNDGINRIRWYRTQALSNGDADFFFLREYTYGATGMQDDGRDLNTLDDPLPTAAATMRIPLDDSATWLTDCWNSFASALVGKTVRFCEPNLLYAWPIGNEYQLTNTPVGQVAFAQRLLVLTTAGAEVFVGSDPAAMDQKSLELPAPVSARSIVGMDSGAMWAAADGLVYYGVDGFRLLTPAMDPEDWRALRPETIVGSFCDGLYFGSYDDGSGLKSFVVDPSNPKGIYPLDKGYHAHYWDKLLRRMFVLDGNVLKEWDAGSTFMTATFRSKRFRQMSHVEGERMEILCDGTAHVKLWVDDELMFDHDVEAGEYTLADGTGGRDWQAEIASSSPVQGLVAE